MKFSIITPCNSTQYLDELYESIVSQTHSDWEWILYLNNMPFDIMRDVRSKYTDDRIKFFFSAEHYDSVGKVKHDAFRLGTGDVLCEVDHDDMLVNTCLERLNEVYEQDASVGFVYSANAVLDIPNAEDFIPYAELCGWRYGKYMYNGRELYAMKPFQPSASSMSIIHFQPDHIRTWRKEAYDSIGGHDESLTILDDQDLLSRTYLNTSCRCIDEVLYIYRFHQNNTFKQKSDDIAKIAKPMQVKYMEQLVLRELAKDSSLIHAVLGYGTDAPEDDGIRTVDLSTCNDGTLPFDDDSVGYICAVGALEYMPDPMQAMLEIYRVLHDDGYVYIEVPSTDGRGAFQDPMHRSLWNINSFLYYTRDAYNKMLRNRGYRIAFREIFSDNVVDNDCGTVTTRIWLQAVKSSSYRCGICDIVQM